eukprot:TRINITY_DN3344_c0_g1_i1.p1 TRINITY_DN3344_c0_g1~~TRINITY_DN3344_c0_g1_i1.p1  ORF type:complete len:413 (-),score=105.40 TRINITY_DN3344_c0_g1_i1:127-1317(-)
MSELDFGGCEADIRLQVRNLDTGDIVYLDSDQAINLDRLSHIGASVKTPSPIPEVENSAPISANPAVSPAVNPATNPTTNPAANPQANSAETKESAFYSQKQQCQVDQGAGLNHGTFLVSEEKIPNLLVKWLSTLWFAPGKVTEKVMVSDVKRYYLPYYLYYVTTQSQYSANVCIIREDIINNQRVRNESWIQSKGVLKTLYKEIMLLGCDGAEDRSYAKTFRKDDWDLNRINYDDPLPSYLKTVAKDDSATKTLKLWASKVGKTFEAESAKLRPTPDQLLPIRGSAPVFSVYEKAKIRPSEKNAAAESLITKHKAERVKDLVLVLDYSDKVERVLHMPVYICTYVYSGKTYHFWVNGHTEKIVGERPFGAGKIGEMSAKGVKAVGAMITHSDKMM